MESKANKKEKTKTVRFKFSKSALRKSSVFLEMKALVKEKLKAERQAKREEKNRELLKLYLELGTATLVGKKKKISRQNVVLRIGKYPEYLNHGHHRVRKEYRTNCIRCGIEFSYFRTRKQKYCSLACFKLTPEERATARQRQMEKARVRARAYYYKNREENLLKNRERFKRWYATHSVEFNAQRRAKLST